MFPIGCMYLASRGVTWHAPSGSWHYLFDNDLVVGMSFYNMQVSFLHSQESTDLGTRGWKWSVFFHYQLIIHWTHFGFCLHHNELCGFRILNAWRRIISYREYSGNYVPPNWKLEFPSDHFGLNMTEKNKLAGNIVTELSLMINLICQEEMCLYSTRRARNTIFGTQQIHKYAFVQFHLSFQFHISTFQFPFRTGIVAFSLRKRSKGIWFGRTKALVWSTR